MARSWRTAYYKNIRIKAAQVKASQKSKVKGQKWGGFAKSVLT